MKKNVIVLLTLTIVSALYCVETDAQATTTNTWPGGTPYIGWSTPHDIDFRIGTGTPPQQYMIIDGTTNLGFVGIGITAPTELLTTGNGVLNHTTGGAWIDISTLGYTPIPLASFTNGLAFGSSGGPLNTQGDGFRIYDPNSSGGDLDLWTSSSNQSHIVWGLNPSRQVLR